MSCRPLFWSPNHTSTDYRQDDFSRYLRLGVPIFLMISGALLLNREYPSLADFLKRRFTRIIYPFIFWIILILGQLYLHGYNSRFIWSVFIGEPSITWYFWTLIGIYLFIPVINSFIKEYGLKGCEYFLAIWFATIILNTFHHYPLWTYFDLNMFSGFIGCPILGYWLTNKKFRLNDRKMCITGLVILILSLGVFVYCGYSKLDFLSPRYLNLSNMFMGVGMFLLIKYMDELNLFSRVKDISSERQLFL